jgi:PST family polysaccharide transporter
MFVAANVDNVLIGAFLGTEALGFYALAFQIVGLPQIVLSGSVYNTLLAGVSEAQRSGGDTAALLLRTLRGVMLVCMPAMIGLAVTASLLVPLVMGAQWLPMVRLIQLLVPYGIVLVFGIATAAFLAGIGRPGLALRLTLISASLTVTAIAGGICIGSEAVATGVSVAALVGLVITLSTIVQKCGVRASGIGHAVAAPLFSAAAMGCAILMLQQMMPGTLSLASRLVASVAMGVAVYGLVLSVLFHDQLAPDIAEIKAAFFIPSRRRQ